ncbi:MAG: hypothetical protein NVS4B12_12350 [Ktedonobacteraceae bacterium]
MTVRHFVVDEQEARRQTAAEQGVFPQIVVYLMAYHLIADFALYEKLEEMENSLVQMA